MFKELSKKQIISMIFIIAIISGFIGWIYEVVFYYFNGGMKDFYMRGNNFLPLIDIYAIGSIMILFLCHKQIKHPIRIFIICVLSTGLLEYLTGYILYGVLGIRKAWDYNTEILNFGNISGYVCLRSVLVFGILGLCMMYMILPLVIKLVKSKHINKIFIISVILFSIFVFDEFYNLVLTKAFDLPRAVEIYENIGIKYMTFE